MDKKESDKWSGEIAEAHLAHAKGLNQRSFFKLGNKALGADLVQETFLKAWLYLLRGGEIDAMRAFLYHILDNLIIDEYRKRKILSLDFLLEKGLEIRSQKQEKPGGAMDAKAAVLLIEDLPQKYAAVLRMRFVKELSLAEIAAATGQTKNAVAVQIHRGILLVQERLLAREKESSTLRTSKNENVD